MHVFASARGENSPLPTSSAGALPKPLSVLRGSRFARWAAALLIATAVAVAGGSARAQAPEADRAGAVIRGTVTGGDDAPLPGVNVFIDGTTTGTTTGSDGRFVLRGLEPGTYTLVASMVGYERKRKAVRVRLPSDTLSYTFELSTKTVKMKGVTVSDSRERWLERLETFKEAFLGPGKMADECSLVNPEVLSFQKRADGALVARTEEPLRMRNEALGYEVTFYLQKFVSKGNLRSRLGAATKFAELAPETGDQREAWRKARARAYRGSFQHLVHALLRQRPREAGFILTQTTTTPLNQGGRTQTSEFKVRRPARILRPTERPGQAVLRIPKGKYLEILYTEEAEQLRFARQVRKRDRPSGRQLSWLEIVGADRAVVNTRTGDYIRRPGSGEYILNGYLGWERSAANSLPGDYTLPGSKEM